MLKQLDRKDVIFIVAVLVLVFGGLTIYKGKVFFNTIRGYDNTIVSVNKRSDLSTSQGKNNQNQYRQNFEASLNGLLKDVYTQMSEYRKRRVLLDKIMRADNLRDAKYIEETYQIAGRTVSDLRQRSSKIILIFNAKDAEIKALVKGRPVEAQRSILASWDKVKKEQVTLYVRYFTIEQDILDRYQSLMVLYYQNRNSVVYFSNANQVSFKDPALNADAGRLLSDINDLKAKQSALTK